MRRAHSGCRGGGSAIAEAPPHGFVAVFGAPSALEDHAELACYTAPEIRRRAYELAERHPVSIFPAGHIRRALVVTPYWV